MKSGIRLVIVSEWEKQMSMLSLPLPALTVKWNNIFDEFIKNNKKNNKKCFTCKCWTFQIINYTIVFICFNHKTLPALPVILHVSARYVQTCSKTKLKDLTRFKLLIL